MSSMTADLAKEIKDRSVEQIMDATLPLIEEMLGVGDTSMTREQRIERFYDDANSGALDVLKVIRPDLYRQTVRQMAKDVGMSPLITYGPDEEAS